MHLLQMSNLLYFSHNKGKEIDKAAGSRESKMLSRPHPPQKARASRVLRKDGARSSLFVCILFNPAAVPKSTFSQPRIALCSG